MIVRDAGRSPRPHAFHAHILRVIDRSSIKGARMSKDIERADLLTSCPSSFMKKGGSPSNLPEEASQGGLRNTMDGTIPSDMWMPAGSER